MLVACCEDPHWASTVVAGHLEREAGRQPGVAGDVHGLHADLVDTPTDDLADLGRVHPGAVEEGFLDVAEHVHGVPGGEFTVAATHRAPHGIDDDDLTFTHGS